MADFEIEQLKTLFDNLADRIDRTKGDQISNTELTKIRNLMAGMSRHIAQGSNDKSKPMDSKAFANEFWNRWKTEDPFKELRANQGNEQGQTIIKRLKDAQDDIHGYADEHGRYSKSTIGNMKRLSDQLGVGVNKFSALFDAIKPGGISALVGGAVGTIFSKVGNYIDDKAGAYRTLVDSGESSVTSISQMNAAANNAAMSVQELAKAMESGTEGARKFGALRWASVTRGLTDAARAAGDFSRGYGQRQEDIGAFIETMNQRGMLQGLTDSQMVSGISAMQKSTAETASILGITRTEALKSQAQQSQNHMMNAALRSSNYDQTSVAAAGDAFEKAMGTGTRQLLNEILVNGSVTTQDSAQIATLTPEIVDLAQQVRGMMANGQPLDQIQMAKMINATATKIRSSDQTAELARLGVATNGKMPIQAGLDARFGLADTQLNTQRAEKKGDDETQLYLKKEQLDRERMAAFNTAVDVTAHTLTDPFAKSLNSAVDAVSNFVRGLSDGMGNWPKTTSAVTTGLFALGSALLFFKGRAASKLLTGAGAGALGGMARSAPKGAGDIIARQAAKNAGRETAEHAGGTILARLMGAKAGMGKAAGRVMGSGVGGKVLGGLAKGGLKSNALFSGLFESYDYLNGSKALTMKNVAKSGLRVGGSMLGGTLGAAGGTLAGGPVGTVAGEIGGSAAGYAGADWLADKIFGADDKPANASNNPKTGSPAPKPKPKVAPANASVSQKNRNVLTMDQMTNKIMEHSDRSATFLKSIKEQSEKQTGMMAEEIVVLKAMSDRLARLLEEGNKNTRSISDQTL